MRGFELVQPASLSEAIKLLDTDDGSVRPMSGGTGLMLMMKAGVFQPSRLVNLSGVEQKHAAIATTADRGLTIGALATLTKVEHSSEVMQAAPIVPRAMKRLANVRVRNVARIGGNLAHGDPHMDLPPVFTALRGEVAVQGPKGERRLALEDLFVGYYETALTQGEVIAALVLPSQRGWASAYQKCTVRSHDDWPALGVGVSLHIKDGAIAESRVVISAATEKLTRVRDAEAALANAKPDAAAFKKAADAAVDTVETIDDSRGSAAYKKELVRVYVGRALADAVKNGAVQ